MVTDTSHKKHPNHSAAPAAIKCPIGNSCAISPAYKIFRFVKCRELNATVPCPYALKLEAETYCALLLTSGS